MPQNEFYQKLIKAVKPNDLELLDQIVLLSHGLERYGNKPEVGKWAVETSREKVSRHLFGVANVKSFEDLKRRVELARAANVQNRRGMGMKVRAITIAKNGPERAEIWKAYGKMSKLLKNLKINGKL
ncbi:hypothetical protein HY989_04620 [Candidatus Micrarchaeota archaeon]|nr:hypothetical protein [Candidatus Micrarchaeota archaeon]